MRASRVLALLFACACWIAPAHAQRATERYVPIGSSPGLSGVSTLTGTVEGLDRERRRLIVRSAAGPREVAVAEATRIWLDRSALGESNAVADLGDCREGRSVEVKLDAGGRTAEWIKIRAPASR